MASTNDLYRLFERLAVAVLLVIVFNLFLREDRTGRSTLVSAAVWIPAIVTIWLTPRALFTGSWPMMWAAALASYVFRIISMFSIGALVFSLNCVQIGAVAAMRRTSSPRGWLLGMLAGALAWVLVVPVQLAGFVWLWGFGIYQVVGLVGLVLAPVADRARSIPESERQTEGCQHWSGSKWRSRWPKPIRTGDREHKPSALPSRSSDFNAVPIWPHSWLSLRKWSMTMRFLRNEPSRIRRSLMAAALVLALLVASPMSVSACSCGGSSRTMPVAFVGRVIAVVESWPLVKRLTGKRRVLIGSTIALLVAKSNDPGTEVKLYAVIGGYDADCYVSFEPGRSYVIYGERVNFGLVHTTICHGSGEV